ncbi:hypothetical protein ACJRO7_015886 [Eucalyptus globulus]|uniref:IBR domain-containing protein n=1 Tax=Eucalyptus globulus TaxID=34317 RepID=A0ABD3L8U3_EUCGL
MATQGAEVVVVDVDRYDVPELRLAPIAATKSDAISVEQYNEDRGLYQAIAASLLQTRPQSLNEDNVRVLDSLSAGTRSSSSQKRKKPYSSSLVTEPGQSSNPKPSIPLILPPEVFDRWGNAVCEALILEEDRFYCLFKDCSALLIKDRGGPPVRESECPNCRRLFCAQCRNEGEREREDIMLMKVAKSKRWNRCPKCSFTLRRFLVARFFYYAKSSLPTVFLWFSVASYT